MLNFHIIFITYRKQYPQISITDTHGHSVEVPSAEDTSVITTEPVLGLEFADPQLIEDEAQVRFLGITFSLLAINFSADL